MMTTPTIQNDQVHFQHGEDHLFVQLHRTLRLPEDGRTHALPPSLGYFPLKRIEDYRERVPAAWREHGGVFFPMWQREAMWLSFHSRRRPFALKVAAGKVNAVSGGEWTTDLRPQTSGSGSEVQSPRSVPSEQDYLVVPPQPWLDGFNSGAGKIRQFVAMPLGMGYTVEAQATGKEDVGGIQLLAIPPKDGLLVPPPRPVFRGAQFKGGGMKHTLSAHPSSYDISSSIGASYSAGPATMDSMNVDFLRSAVNSKGAEMGLAEGGEMEQKIYPDPHGIDTWLVSAGQRLFVHIVNSQLYEQITGQKAPPTPITAQTYAHYGYPWYQLWDEKMGDVPASSVLSGVKTVGQMDQKHGFSGQQDDSPVHEQVVSAGSVVPGGVLEGKEWR